LGDWLSRFGSCPPTPNPRGISAMRQLRDRVREEAFLAEVRRQQIEGYRLFALFDTERLLALAGVRRTHTSRAASTSSWTAWSRPRASGGAGGS
jgi:hypothetical protein